MICLTGDLHHMSMKGSDQNYLRGTEVDAAIRYVEIANRYGINSTLFVTGRCVEEEHRKLTQLAQFNTVELGGHTYNAFKPLFFYRTSSLLLNRKNGPSFVQKIEIQKTVDTMKNRLGGKVQSWRDHGYRNDVNTRKLLFAAGIRYFSDARSAKAILPYKDEGLVHFPINVLPDHDHIYHGAYKYISKTENSRKKTHYFNESRMDIKAWFDLVKLQIEKIEKKNGIATLLVHPGCMEIADDFKIFAELCHYLSNFDTIKMSDIKRELV